MSPAGRSADLLRPLLEGGYADGARGTVVFCTGPAGTDAERAATDVRAAGALAKALVGHRYGVLLLPQGRWPEIPADALAVIATTPVFDPALVPAGSTAVGWAVDRPEAWPRHSALTLFDAVLGGSALVRDRVAGALEALGVTHPPLLDVLPLAASVDAAAVPASPARGVRERAGRLRHRTEPLRVLPVGDPAARAAGVVPAAVHQALADGALPLPDSRLGLADLGYGDLPSYRSARERDQQVSALAHDPAARELATSLAALVRREHTWTARARTLDALLGRLGRPAGRPPTVGFFPDFRVTNPYQDMLYAALPAQGVRVAPVRALTERLALRDSADSAGNGDLTGYVLHVHWTAAVVQVTPDPAEARRRLDTFTALLRDLKSRGGRVAWTVHNVLPHELAHRDLEVELCRLLAAEADLVHVMSPDTLELTRPAYELDPATVEVVPHSSYDGVYPDLVSRAEARRRFGLFEHDVALLALGGIRAYRGLDTLLDAFDTLLERDLRVKLLVAGKPGPDPQVAEWLERCERHPRIVARFEHVPEADLQLWNRAADIAVLPYRAILNSGAFKLAETFGLPVVAPREGNLARVLDPAYAVGFDPDVPGDLLAALERAVDLVTDPAATARAHERARAAATAYPPSRMAEDFAAVLEKRLLSRDTVR